MREEASDSGAWTAMFPSKDDGMNSDTEAGRVRTDALPVCPCDIGAGVVVADEGPGFIALGVPGMIDAEEGGGSRG